VSVRDGKERSGTWRGATQRVRPVGKELLAPCAIGGLRSVRGRREEGFLIKHLQRKGRGS